jgi:SAM-dependent methyltransferase
MEAEVFARMAELDSEHWWFAARRDILDSAIRRIVRPPEGARILEIGCGTGHNLEMLARFGRVEATELNDTARALATSRLGRKIHAAALPDLSMFKPSSFDMVALLDVLEHIGDDKAALAAIRDILKPGGALLVTVPANKWMWSAHDVSHHHHRRYRRSEIARLAETAGLDVQLLTHFNSLLFPLIAAARVAGKLTGRESADDSMPPAPLNGVLRSIFGLEAPLVGRLPMPVGVSLLAVLRRPVDLEEIPAGAR